MPLVIFTVFFLILFSCEACWFITKAAREEKALKRYQSVEHPRRITTDRYLDLLG